MAAVGLIRLRMFRHCHHSIFNTVGLESVWTLHHPPFVFMVELLNDSGLLICDLFTKRVNACFIQLNHE